MKCETSETKIRTRRGTTGGAIRETRCPTKASTKTSTKTPTKGTAKGATKDTMKGANKRWVAPELRREMRMDGTRRARVPHTTRPEMRGAAHVVIKIRRGLPSLRTPRAWRLIEGSYRKIQSLDGFRLLQFTVQRDHMHMAVEASDRMRLARVLQGFMIRVAKRLNRLWHRRVGSVFADRYFAIAITSWKQFRRTIAYILGNGRRHGEAIEKGQPDPYSSARWFRWWSESDSIRRSLRRPPVEPPRIYQIFAQMPIDHVPGPASWAANHSVTTEPLD